ncbi:MAG TPA: radical SAM protein [Acidimicrobiia bacterium]|nr:radical SAM protein [Acidimicrobiia bacterium]
MRILLVSTYELGHQPLHLASPAARLLKEGHEVAGHDLAVEDWDEAKFAWAEGIAFSVPMHTAMRMSVAAAEKVQRSWPEKPIAFYGLYAGLADERYTRLVGEYEDGLVAWVGGSRRSQVDLSRHRFEIPHRSGLPTLDRYGHLATGENQAMAGYVEASHGCRHRCRHCPIPAVYDGRYRVTGADVVLSDIESQVAAGARHITFGDPDFLNAPRYSLDLLAAAHERFPAITFDLTVKVSHILQHQKVWPEVAERGVVFVVSAFETTNERVLRILDKGHTAADMDQAVSIMAKAGIDIRPSWLPFTPWTEVSDVGSILRFLHHHHLADTVDPVQLSIRLLVPRGSLLADRPEMGKYDGASLTHVWSASEAVEAQQQGLAAIAEAGAGRPTLQTLARMWEFVFSEPMPAVTDRGRPHLTESWFCCAEPTRSQLLTVSGSSA